MNVRWMIAAAVLAALSLAAAACGNGGEDRPGVTIVGGGTGTGSGTGTGTGTGTGIGTEPGVVGEKPEGATQLNVTLQEWAVIPESVTVPAGDTYLLATNAGPDDPHELVVAKTDLAPNSLPTVDGRVPEDEVEVIGEIEPFAPASAASATLTLGPGRYVLFCSIVEVENGELESHYELGMYAGLTVE